MIKVEMSGGIGNQLFIYAFYRSLQLEGKKVILDLSWYKNVNDSTHAKYHLDIFNTKIESYCVLPVWDRIRHILRRRKIDIALSRVGIINKFVEKDPGMFDEKVLTIRNGYISGTWQTEKYFSKYRDIIRTELRFIGEWSENNQSIKKQMIETESVSIHVRRGDYLKFNHLYGNICTVEYYNQAMQVLKSKIEETNNIHYFVFSDDIAWCKKELFSAVSNVTYVMGNEEDTSYMDMILMSYCKHHILANSSFSWWGEWLSEKQGVTVAPRTWINGLETKDVWRKNWIKV